MTFRFLFRVFNFIAKKNIIKKWGKEFYLTYLKMAKKKLQELEYELPHRVDSHFDADYKGIVACVPIYYSLMQQNISHNEINMIIWETFEGLYKFVPKSLMRGKMKYMKMLERLRLYQRKGEQGLLEKNDWIMEIKEEDGGSYYCTVVECGAYKILKNKGYDFVFPCMCRLDYFLMNLRGFKFERDKTIGDGYDVCNNHIMGLGFTEWAPEKGFSSRK